MPSRAGRVVIITALPIEIAAVRAHLKDVQLKTYKGSAYDQGTFSSGDKTWEVLLVQAGAGNSPTAAEAERALGFFKPSVALFVGVAGGLKEAQLGDVVVATKVYGYASGKAGATFQTRPDVGESTYDLVQLAHATVRTTDWHARLGRSRRKPRVHVGPLAAGEQVLASTRSATFSFLRKHYEDALAVEMEGRGFLAAMRMNRKVAAIVVRGISDRLDDKAAADSRGSQQVASRNASAFAFELLATLVKSPWKPKGSRSSSSGLKLPRLVPNRGRARRPTTGAPSTRSASILDTTHDLRLDSRQKLRIFISSRLSRELAHERRIAAKTIENVFLTEAWYWERDGINSLRSVEGLCLTNARLSDLLLVLVGQDVSPMVQREFKAAYSAGKPCFVLVKRSATPTTSSQRFINSLSRLGIPVSNFDNTSELKTRITLQIQTLAVNAFRHQHGMPSGLARPGEPSPSHPARRMRKP